MFQQKGAHVAQLYSIHAVKLEGWTELEVSSDTPLDDDHSVPTITATLQSLSEVQHQDSLQLLLIEFGDLFAESTTLPLPQPFDHSIHLKLNLEPVNIRSCKYSPIQKAEIEKLVKDMLGTFIIQPIQSPFASPILFVKKKYLAILH